MIVKIRDARILTENLCDYNRNRKVIGFTMADASFLCFEFLSEPAALKAMAEIDDAYAADKKIVNIDTSQLKRSN